MADMQDAKGGEGEDRFAMSRNFLATDKVPESIFGIPVVQDEDAWTEADLEFFRKHPEAGGYYDMGEETPEDGSAEGAPTQADRAGNAGEFVLNGNLRTEGRPRYLFRDNEGKVMKYGTQLSMVARDADGTWVAIPTIVDGKAPLSEAAAFEHYRKTGEFFHRGKTREEAHAGAIAAHEKSQAQDMAWWNNYIADHLDDGTLSTIDKAMRETTGDPGFRRWAEGREKGMYERVPGSGDKGLRQDAKGGEARGRYPGKLNNPGNVEKRVERRRGEIASPHKRWAKFATPQDGLREMADVMRQIADVKLAEKNQPFTIRNFAEVYAPRFNEKGEPENDTDKYIRDISSTSGIDADTVLDRWNTDDMARLMKTIVRFESGVPHSRWFTDDEYRTAARELEEGATD